MVALRRQLAEKEAELRQLRGEYNAFKVRPDELKEQNIIFTKENKNLRKVCWLSISKIRVKSGLFNWFVSCAIALQSGVVSKICEVCLSHRANECCDD